MKTSLKNSIKLLTIIVFILISNPVLLTAQVPIVSLQKSSDENQKEISTKQKVNKKNHSLMFNIGLYYLVGQMSGQLDLNFARGGYYKINARFSGGMIFSGDYDGGGDCSYYGTTGLAFLIGKNKYYLDIYVGLNFAEDHMYSDFEETPFTFSLSYRYESNSGFVFNIGVGSIQLPFIGVGFRF